MNDRIFTPGRPIIDWRCTRCVRLKSSIVHTGCGNASGQTLEPESDRYVVACPMVPIYGAEPRTRFQRLKDFFRP